MFTSQKDIRVEELEDWERVNQIINYRIEYLSGREVYRDAETGKFISEQEAIKRSA